ncbi:hypothetical protein C8Q75DRAFT_735010 [Abortiporus biennis]|nr:hypothetical protein C8Q75DRAFT_735010 [Abortiporus biennis]
MSDNDLDLLDLEFIYYQAAGYAASFARAQFLRKALVIYEYALTVDQETELIWKRKLNLASAIFLLNRYSLLSMAVVMFLQYFQFRDIQICSNIGMELANAIFFTLRIWAIWGRHWLLLVVLGPLTVYIIVTTSCISFVFTSLGIRLNLASNAFLMLVVLLALIATVLKTFSIKRIADTARMRHSLAKLLMRDGSLYLCITWAMQVLEIFTVVSEHTGRNPGSEFIQGLSLVESNGLRMSSIQFMGNIGAPVSTFRSDGEAVIPSDDEEANQVSRSQSFVINVEDLDNPLMIGLQEDDGE